ncbi:MAG: PHP domain-containing protein [Nanoarchaeota archaeon]|nr:PHP domain-containing protein [Nanoarchaeota archaeon]
MLKADLHIHVQGDPRHHIKYTAQQLIDRASELGFEVLAITNHDQLFYNETLANYAKSKGILLIPGIEKTIEGNEVLIYNVTQKDVERIRSFEDLMMLKREKDILVIAPHPYFLLPNCLGKNLEKYIHVFDGIEYCHFYNRLINRNRKAVRVAKKFDKAVVGTSDVHDWFQFNNTYTLVDGKKSVSSVIEAIKRGKCQLKTRPLSWFNFMKVPLNVLIFTSKRITFINKN